MLISLFGLIEGYLLGRGLAFSCWGDVPRGHGKELGSAVAKARCNNHEAYASVAFKICDSSREMGRPCRPSTCVTRAGGQLVAILSHFHWLP